ncbi:hypothetical protein SEPCBS119000_004048 [Sporothrix epigloea]|uniref:ribonuclease T1 n=1 Tax=Sporothrix epigloea TaxID=1892477 RepID=A0ABP0DRU1_9PEZI
MNDLPKIHNIPSLSEASNNGHVTGEQISAAIGKALDLLKEGMQIGPDEYPRAYKKFATRVQAPIFEYPVLQDGSIYDGKGSPGPDRVVFGAVAADYTAAEYVGVATVAPDDPYAIGAPLTLSGSYKPHFFNCYWFEKVSEPLPSHCHDHEHGHTHCHDHKNGPGGQKIPPPLTQTATKVRTLLTDSDVKVPFSD